MKDTDYNNIPKFGISFPNLTPINEPAIELLESEDNTIIELQPVKVRDVSFHRAYFGLLAYIYDYLPSIFKKAVAKEKFYKWLKHLKGEYKILFEFKDGSKFIEYDSISFGKMSQITFENYVREQLPFIYENIIGEFYTGKNYEAVIFNIESEFEKFLSKL